jgi:hypothetical protein
MGEWVATMNCDRIATSCPTAASRRRVDLPEPFSPTKRVTAVGKRSVSSRRMAGSE